VEVAGVAESRAPGRACLDTGNASMTVITRALAERLGLVHTDGTPAMVKPSARRSVETTGVVAGQSEVQFIIPSVTFAIRGVEITSDVSVQGRDDGIGQHGIDLLVSMRDIKKLVAGGAVFDPCRGTGQ
jgi:predicted aspartyl protease